MSEHRPSDERGGDDSGFFDDDATVADEGEAEVDDEATDAERERLTGERPPSTQPHAHP